MNCGNARQRRISFQNPLHPAAAAAHSGVDTVVAELTQGWDSVLSREFQNGCDLSGGQWQRISVARGLYRDAPLLIADEPTAAMDARAEHAVFQSLQSLRRTDHAPGNGASPRATRTTVLITHRLANIRHADQIIVLDHGRITESGKNWGRRGSHPLPPRLGPLTPALHPPRPQKQ